jgi:hypothetical protein
VAADKELALRMLDVLEELEAENRAYRALLKALGSGRPVPPAKQIHQLLAEAKAAIRDRVHQEFAPLRDRLQQSEHLSDSIQELLRVLPAKKDVN